jgi:hypothetical protein
MTDLNQTLTAEELDALEDFLAQPDLEARSLIKPASRSVPKQPLAPTCQQPYAHHLDVAQLAPRDRSSARAGAGHSLWRQRQWCGQRSPAASDW